MTKALRLTAHPVSRILCAKSRETVGYLYVWNNGDRQPAWIGKRVRDVTYVPLVRNESVSARSALMAGRDEQDSEKSAPTVNVQLLGLN